jgi:hypothetical protein
MAAMRCLTFNRSGFAINENIEGLAMNRGKWLCALTLVALVAAVGCSTGPAVGTVNGEVTFDGQPVKDGHVSFTPVDGKGQTGGAPINEGKFKAEQVSATKMKVELHGNRLTGKKIKAYDTPESPVMDEVAELLPSKYNFNSELTLEVKRGTQDVKYELKSK